MVLCRGQVFSTTIRTPSRVGQRSTMRPSAQTTTRSIFTACSAVQRKPNCSPTLACRRRTLTSLKPFQQSSR